MNRAKQDTGERRQFAGDRRAVWRGGRRDTDWLNRPSIPTVRLVNLTKLPKREKARPAVLTR